MMTDPSHTLDTLRLILQVSLIKSKHIEVFSWFPLSRTSTWRSRLCSTTTLTLILDPLSGIWRQISVNTMSRTMRWLVLLVFEDDYLYTALQLIIVFLGEENVPLRILDEVCPNINVVVITNIWSTIDDDHCWIVTYYYTRCVQTFLRMRRRFSRARSSRPRKLSGARAQDRCVAKKIYPPIF